MERPRPFFPKSHGHARVDDCCVLSGIIFINRNGFRWCGYTSGTWLSQDPHNRWKRMGVSSARGDRSPDIKRHSVLFPTRSHPIMPMRSDRNLRFRSAKNWVLSGADQERRDRHMDAGIGQDFSQPNRKGESGECHIHVRNILIDGQPNLENDGANQPIRCRPAFRNTRCGVL